MSAENTPGNSLPSLDSLDWSDIPVLEEEPDPEQYWQPKEAPKPELTPQIREKLLNDIATVVQSTKTIDAEQVRKEGEYETVLSSPVDSGVVKPSSEKNGIVIKLWQHRSVNSGGIIDIEKAVYLVTFHESVPRKDGGFDFYTDSAASIPFRSAEL